MARIDYETYTEICLLLAEGTDLEPTYSVDEIAEMVGVSVETVQEIDRAENE